MGAFGKMVASWLKSAAKQAAAADRIPRYVRVIYREMGDMRPVVAGRSKLYVFRWPFRVEPTWGGWVRVPGLDGDSTGVVVEPGAASDYPGEIRQVKALLPDLPVLPIYRSAPSHDVYHLPPIAAGLRPYPAWGNPVSELEVEFEHLHRGEIQAIFTERLGHVREPESLRGEQALLVPVRDSPYPAVVIDGLWVGNVLDDRVLSLLPHIQSLLRQGAALQVEARLWGLADNGVFRSRITLRLPAPEAIQPPGPFPAGACLLLPRGSSIQVTGEEEFLNELSALLGGAAERSVVAELYRLEIATARSLKTVVGVRIYGDEAGRLSPASSEHLLPLVIACAEEGVTPCCRAVVKGNQLKADVVLHVRKAGDLSDQWLRQHLYTPLQYFESDGR